MAESARLAGYSPYKIPRTDPRRAALLERGADLRPCPDCGTEAEFEPPILVNGGKWLAVIRCPKCGPIIRELPREESNPVIKPPLCKCGCGEPVARLGRGNGWKSYASDQCKWRANAQARRKEKSSTPQGPPPVTPEAGDFSCHGASPPGTSDEFAPGHGGLSHSQPGPLGDGAPVGGNLWATITDPIEHLITACPILAAVAALEAVPADKLADVLQVVEARREAALAMARAEGLLAALRGVA